MQSNADDPVCTFAVRDDHDYRPVADLWHGATVLIKDAKANPAGSYYKRMGAILLLAATVEGFGQTLGPELFPGDWIEGREYERLGPYEKLKKIARKAHVSVATDRDPWKSVRAIIKARNDFAHPKPASKTIERFVTCRQSEVDDATRVGMEDHFPILSEAETDRVAQCVKDALEMIWRGLGRYPLLLFMHGGSVGSVRRVA